MKIPERNLRTKSNMDYIADVDYVWNAFSEIKKDKTGGLTPGVALDEFMRNAKLIDPAMYRIIKMLATSIVELVVLTLLLSKTRVIRIRVLFQLFRKLLVE